MTKEQRDQDDGVFDLEHGNSRDEDLIALVSYLRDFRSLATAGQQEIICELRSFPTESRSTLTPPPMPPTITRTPAPDQLTPTTPLRLQAAAELGFPDGSMSAASLRRMIVAGKLEAEFIAGKYFTTLANIEEMRNRCRVKPKDQDSNSKITKTDQHHGSSATENGPLAQAAMNLIAAELKKPLPHTSPRNTTPRRRLTPRT